MDNKIFKVNLEYSSGRYCTPIFFSGTDLTEVAAQVYKKFNGVFHIKEILEDKPSIESRLFRVIYYGSYDEGYGESCHEDHRGFVKGYTENEAWENARLISKENRYWPEYIEEVKADSKQELINYLIKNFS